MDDRLGDLERRHWVLAGVGLLVAATCRHAQALLLSDLTQGEALAGVREALTRGAGAAVSRLGVDGGFLGNPKVKIALPDALQRVEKLLRLAGQGPQLDELVATMNRAAEKAVPEARPLLVNAVRTMSVADAKQILAGGDSSVTDFFRSRTYAPLVEKFLPTVKGWTDRVGLAQRYNRLADQATRYGLVKGADSRVERHVTRKSLDGLYLLIGEEERAIRADPVAAGSRVLERVFGVLK